MSDLICSKLGMDGTQRKSSIKITGSKKVYESRTEMLRDLNTAIPQLPPRFRFTEPGRQKTSSVKDVSNLIEVTPSLPVGATDIACKRLNKWNEERKAKLMDKKLKEESEPEMLGAAPRTRLNRNDMQSFLSRMDRHATRRVDKLKDFDARVIEGLRKLSSSGAKDDEATKKRHVRLKRLRSMQ